MINSIQELKAFLEKEMGEDKGFVSVLFTHGKGHIDMTSNVPREVVIIILEQLILQMKAGPGLDVPSLN